LRDEVSRRTGSQYNFVLVNYYSDGKDSISYHSDGEDFLGPNPTIASLTLGAPRDFLMRPIPPKKGANEPEKVSSTAEKWTLESGDMIVMRGTTQSTWEHSIPKRANAKGRRPL
jgi:alkylated DNA repair dioxygenase AlkB